MLGNPGRQPHCCSSDAAFDDEYAQVNLIIANEITPHLTAEEYMDKGEYENELKQVIGDTKVRVKLVAPDTNCLS